MGRRQYHFCHSKTVLSALKSSFGSAMKNSHHPPRRRRMAVSSRLQSTVWLMILVCTTFLSKSTTVAFSSPHFSSLKTEGSGMILFAKPDGRDTKQRNPTDSRPRIKRQHSSKRKILNGSRPRRQQAPTSRPILIDYEENTSVHVNKQRLCGAINCEHFEHCSGCVVNGNVGEVTTIHSAKKFFSSPWIRQKMVQRPENNQEFYKVIVPSPLNAWRTQAKLVAAPKSSTWAKDGCTFGLYRQRTHQVVRIPDCEVHHPSINRAIQVLEEATERAGTSAYEEDTREGGLRYAQFQVERTTGKVCLTLVWNAESLKGAQPALSRLVKELSRRDPDLWHSIWCNCNDSVGNNIVSRSPSKWHRLSGPEFLREPLAIGNMGWVYFTPLTFRQGNLDGFDILANDVARRVPGGSKVCELYAGVGLLGLTTLAHHAQSDREDLKWLRCSDENPSNPRCFERSVNTLPPEWIGAGSDKKKADDQKELVIAALMARIESGKVDEEKSPVGEKTSYMVASAARALQSGQALGADTLIVDPPRKGLEPEVLGELCKKVDLEQIYVEDISMLTIPDEIVKWTNDVRTLIYVSCGFDALAHDAERLLTSNAGWMLESATGYVLFPGSDHVETVCVFTRHD